MKWGRDLNLKSQALQLLLYLSPCIVHVLNRSYQVSSWWLCHSSVQRMSVCLHFVSFSFYHHWMTIKHWWSLSENLNFEHKFTSVFSKKTIKNLSQFTILYYFHFIWKKEKDQDRNIRKVKSLPSGYSWNAQGCPGLVCIKTGVHNSSLVSLDVTTQTGTCPNICCFPGWTEVVKCNQKRKHDSNSGTVQRMEMSKAVSEMLHQRCSLTQSVGFEFMHLFSTMHQCFVLF